MIGGVRMLCIVLYGAPGCGKSTIGKMAAQNLGIKYISSGDIARKHATHDELEDLNNGMMFNEDRMRSMVHDEIKCMCDNDMLILDGFPRFKEQFDWMIRNLSYKAEFIQCIIDTPILEAITRVNNRNRSDINGTSMRFEYYINSTLPLIDSLRGTAYTIYNSDNEQIDDVVESLIHIIRKESEIYNAVNSEI